MRIFVISYLLFVVAFVFGTQVALAAAELNLRYSPPCLLQGAEGFGSCNDTTNVFASYIKRIYQFGLGIAGVLAVGMIIAGAIRRVVSAGNPSGITESNSMITSALWGIALLFGSYLILRTINPVLVSLRDPSAPQVTGINPFAYQTASSTCPVPSHTSCFFDPVKMAAGASSTAYCDPESNSVCTAIDLTTDVCNPSILRRPDENGRARPTHQEAPCVCEGCKPTKIGARLLPSANNICNQEFDVLNKREKLCFLKDGFAPALEDAVIRGGGRWGNDNGLWRLGEAFPPVYPHQTRGHYNGSVVDLGLSGGVDSIEKCRQVIEVAKKLADNSRITRVAIEGTTDTGVAPRGSISPECNALFVTVASSNDKIVRWDVRDFHLHVESSF